MDMVATASLHAWLRLEYECTHWCHNCMHQGPFVCSMSGSRSLSPCASRATGSGDVHSVPTSLHVGAGRGGTRGNPRICVATDLNSPANCAHSTTLANKYPSKMGLKGKNTAQLRYMSGFGEYAKPARAIDCCHRAQGQGKTCHSYLDCRQ